MPAVLVLGTVGLAGCGGTSTPLEPILSADNTDGDVEGRKMIGKPYKVGGKWYHPKVDENYDKTGMASWYGPKFHGKRTANGERFDQHALTGAHPTLPIPSYVRVTAVSSGKSAVIRINDRGPFHGGRIIDVSRATADELGFRNKGHAKVRVEYLGPAPVDGSDKETRLAAAKYGKSPKSRGFLGLGGGSDSKSDKDVEVRLAAATDSPAPAPVGQQTARNGTLPGVRVPEAPMRPRSNADSMTPASASAYQEQGDDGSGAIEAVMTMKTPPAPEKHLEVQPLPETAEEESQDRVMGAHDMFASLGMGPMDTKSDAPAGAEAPAAADDATAEEDEAAQ